MVVQHNLTAMNSNRMLGITTNAQDGVSAVQTAEGALTEVHSMLQRMNELANQASNETNSASDRDAIQAEIDQLTTEIDRVSETTKFNETYLLKGNADGTTKTVTAETPKTLDEIEKDTLLDTVGAKVSIGSKEYTIQTSTDLDKNQITKDDFLAMIKDGDKVGITGANNTPFTAIVKATDDDSITLDEAYSKMAEELKTASSIGTDTAATVKNNGNGTFEITQGSVKVKGINVSDNNGVAATYAIDAIADAISKVSSQRSALGAVQNRLEHTISNLDNVVENTTAAESRIRDTDMAEEMVNYSKSRQLYFTKKGFFGIPFLISF